MGHGDERLHVACKGRELPLIARRIDYQEEIGLCRGAFLHQRRICLTEWQGWVGDGSTSSVHVLKRLDHSKDIDNCRAIPYFQRFAVKAHKGYAWAWGDSDASDIALG